MVTFNKAFSLKNLSTVNKRWFISTISSYGFKLVSLLFTIFSTKLLLNNLGVSEFGILAVFTTIISTLSFADFGLGYYFSLVWPELREENKGNSKEFATTFFFLSIVSLILIGLVVFMWLTPLEFFFANNNILIKYKVTVSIVLLITAISLPTTLIQRIYFAEQNGLVISIVNIFSMIISFFLLHLGIKFNLSINFYVIVLYGVTPCFWLFLMVFFLVKNKVKIFKIRSLVSYEFLVKSFKAGLSYFIVQLANICLNSTGVLMISSYCGVEVLAKVNILNKLAQVLVIPFEGISSNFLPAMNVSLAKNNIEWVKKSYFLLLKAAVLYSFCFFFIIVFAGNSIINIWLKNKFTEVNFYILVSLALFFTYRVFESVVSSVMSAKLLLSYLRWLYPIAVFFTLCFIYFIIRKFSIIGYFSVFAISMFVFYLFPSIAIINKKILAKKTT